MYQTFLTKEAEKEAKRQGKQFKTKLGEILQRLSFDPYPLQAERLSGELNFICSYHFSCFGVSFRLAYTVDEEKKIITVVMVGPRENFYKILKRKLR